MNEPFQLLNRFKLALGAGDYETFSTQLALNDEIMTSEEFFALQADYASTDSSSVSQLLFLYPLNGNGESILIEYVQTGEAERPYAISRVIRVPREMADLLQEALNP